MKNSRLLHGPEMGEKPSLITLEEFLIHGVKYAFPATRGIALAPLYKSVPEAAKLDSLLYERLVLIDAIRDGRARERNLAEKELKNSMKNLIG